MLPLFSVFQVFQVRKINGKEVGKIFAMKVLKKVGQVKRSCKINQFSNPLRFWVCLFDLFLIFLNAF